MRRDMAKLLTETYKVKDPWTQTNRAKLYENHDEVGGRIKVEKTKSFGENLAPLYRYLESQVGRPWDKVWSEICANLDSRRTVGQHVKDHTFDRVTPAEKVKIVDGKPVCKGGDYRTEGSPLSSQLYVHPVDGLLKRNKQYRSYSRIHREAVEKAAADVAKVKRILSKTEELHKIDGIWYMFTLEPRRFKTVYEQPLTGEYSGNAGYWAFHGLSNAEKKAVGKPCQVRDESQGYFVRKPGNTELWRDWSKDKYVYVAKRQLSHKELVKWELV